MSSQKLRNLRTYHFRNSRALDVARWNYQFEDGSVQDVLKALACYQNADGGFGHGLEPDIRTAESNPMSTWAATRILRECHLPDMSDRMIQKILSYLAASLREDRRWPATVEVTSEAPHAPWYHYVPGTEVWGWNPTIELSAFILTCAQRPSDLYSLAEQIIKEAMTAIMSPDFTPEGHELSNICEAGTMLLKVRSDLLPDNFFSRVIQLIDKLIVRDLSQYNNTDYIITPEFILNSPDSPYYPGISSIADQYCTYLEQSINESGYWDLNWTWGNDPLPPDSQREWRGVLIMQHMLYLQHFKPLP